MWNLYPKNIMYQKKIFLTARLISYKIEDWKVKFLDLDYRLPLLTEGNNKTFIMVQSQ